MPEEGNEEYSYQGQEEESVYRKELKADDERAEVSKRLCYLVAEEPHVPDSDYSILEGQVPHHHPDDGGKDSPDHEQNGVISESTTERVLLARPECRGGRHEKSFHFVYVQHTIANLPEVYISLMDDSRLTGNDVFSRFISEQANQPFHFHSLHERSTMFVWKLVLGIVNT